MNIIEERVKYELEDIEKSLEFLDEKIYYEKKEEELYNYEIIIDLLHSYKRLLKDYDYIRNTKQR